MYLLVVYAWVAAVASTGAFTGARVQGDTGQALLIAMLSGLLWPVIVVGLAELALLMAMAAALRSAEVRL